MTLKTICKHAAAALIFATFNTLLAFIVTYSISHIGFLQKGFEMFFGAEPRLDWNEQLKTLAVVYAILIPLIFAVFMLQEWHTQKQLRKNAPYEIVGKVHIFDITHLPPNMTKRQMKKWAEAHPEYDRVFDPNEITMPKEEARYHSFIEPDEAHKGWIEKAVKEARETLLTHPNGTLFDASKIDTKPIETTPQIVPKEPITTTQIIHNGDFSHYTAEIKPQPFVLKDGEHADEFSIIPPSLLEEAERNIKLIQAVRLLTESIALSQISGENTKAQMRDKIIKAREIIEELKRQK